MITHDFDLRQSRFAVRQQLDKQYGDNDYRYGLNTCHMPFGVSAAIGVLAAVGTTGVTMGVVGAAVTVVAAAATVAGVVMTVVGVATGDTELMKIGGIVGLAGGVAGLAGGAISSSAAAATAAQTTASEGAKVAVGEVAARGATNAVPQMSSTVANMSPAAVHSSSALGSALPVTAVAPSGNVLSSGVLSGASQGVAPASLANIGTDVGAKTGLSGAFSGSSDSYGWLGKLVGLGSDPGAGVGVTGVADNVVTGATKTAADTGLGMLDYIGIAGLGASAISQYQQGETANKAALARNEIDINTYNDNKARLDRQYKNANTQANFSMKVAEPTPEQLAAYNKPKLMTPTIVR